MCYAFGIVFLVCELGERASGTFFEISDEIDQLKWYLFSDQIKRMFPTILIFAQQSVNFECFGSILCNREAFQSVSLETGIGHCLNFDTFHLKIILMKSLFSRWSTRDSHTQ